ncbi:hypothetical protein GCM10011512_03600 [Tersicoccus solisilvae]|uniref:DUF2332 domain-containing protein n=1 Tax=Tersicoccus solisilvae TaxID=1882339 RepID=A0ABQ1NLM1_9MICC|nr:DUF2332 domain-containing protein [Tersicoccus solisilvae]GGC80192.1 hypothetical protein GCM10011512_03600 [Tersicoccus solisilvae]
MITVDLTAVASHFQHQAAACGRLGSPLYAALLPRLAEDLLADGPTAAVIAGHEHRPESDALSLRLLGGAHRLALSGHAPALAAHLPSCGGDGDVVGAWAALRRLLVDERETLRRGLDWAPQTNEVGRSSSLLGGLLTVLGQGPLADRTPVRLFELGTSGGLNLRADHYRYTDAHGASWGPEHSPVHLAGAWTAVPAGAPDRVDLVERVGGDVNPIDAATDEGALRLMSFVWPDQTARMERLRGAIEVAHRVPARLERISALPFIQAIEPTPGTLTVFWHSVMWQYIGPAEAAASAQAIERIGARATAAAPFLHLSMEPGDRWRRGFPVTARLWRGADDDGVVHALGVAPAHGIPTRWSATA